MIKKQNLNYFQPLEYNVLDLLQSTVLLQYYVPAFQIGEFRFLYQTSQEVANPPSSGLSEPNHLYVDEAGGSKAIESPPSQKRFEVPNTDLGWGKFIKEHNQLEVSLRYKILPYSAH